MSNKFYKGEKVLIKNNEKTRNYFGAYVGTQGTIERVYYDNTGQFINCYDIKTWDDKIYMCVEDYLEQLIGLDLDIDWDDIFDEDEDFFTHDSKDKDDCPHDETKIVDMIYGRFKMCVKCKKDLGDV